MHCLFLEVSITLSDHGWPLITETSESTIKLWVGEGLQQWFICIVSFRKTVEWVLMYKPFPSEQVASYPSDKRIYIYISTFTLAQIKTMRKWKRGSIFSGKRLEVTRQRSWETGVTPWEGWVPVGPRKKPPAAGRAEGWTGTEATNKSWMAREEEVGYWRKKTPASPFFLQLPLCLLETWRLESAACNSCKVLTLIQAARADGCFQLQQGMLQLAPEAWGEGSWWILRNLWQETCKAY